MPKMGGKIPLIMLQRNIDGLSIGRIQIGKVQAGGDRSRASSSRKRSGVPTSTQSPA